MKLKPKKYIPQIDIKFIKPKAWKYWKHELTKKNLMEPKPKWIKNIYINL